MVNMVVVSHLFAAPPAAPFLVYEHESNILNTKRPDRTSDPRSAAMVVRPRLLEVCRHILLLILPYFNSMSCPILSIGLLYFFSMCCPIFPLNVGMGHSVSLCGLPRFVRVGRPPFPIIFGMCRPPLPLAFSAKKNCLWRGCGSKDCQSVSIPSLPSARFAR